MQVCHQTSYAQALVFNPNSVLGRFSLLRLVSLLPDPHQTCCMTGGELDGRPWPDSPGILVHDAHLIMFADGSWTQDKSGQINALCARVTSFKILEACIIPRTKLAQQSSQ